MNVLKKCFTLTTVVMFNTQIQNCKNERLCSVWTEKWSSSATDVDNGLTIYGYGN